MERGPQQGLWNRTESPVAPPYRLRVLTRLHRQSLFLPRKQNPPPPFMPEACKCCAVPSTGHSLIPPLLRTASKAQGGAAEMAQWLRALVTLSEDMSSTPSSHMESVTPVPGPRMPSLASLGTLHTCGAQTCMQAKTYMHIE